MKPTRLALLASLTLLAACDMHNTGNDPQKTGSITQHLKMIGTDGKIYGTVELDPINGGKIYDAEGRVIGRIITPAPVMVAPTVQVPSSAY